jgi:DNA-binding response OmpR family regulator
MNQGSGLRALIVDGEAEAGLRLAWQLRERGIEALPVRTGAEALAAVPTFRPHVALLEATLPDGTGYELAPALAKASRCDLLIALVARAADLARCAAAGIRHIFPKSPEPRALFLTLAGERYRRACLAEWPNRQPGPEGGSPPDPPC